MKTIKNESIEEAAVLIYVWSTVDDEFEETLFTYANIKLTELEVINILLETLYLGIILTIKTAYIRFGEKESTALTKKLIEGIFYTFDHLSKKGNFSKKWKKGFRANLIDRENLYSKDNILRQFKKQLTKSTNHKISKKILEAYAKNKLASFNKLKVCDVLEENNNQE
jgi:hypothetical protein